MAVDHLNASIVVLGRPRLYWVSAAIMSMYRAKGVRGGEENHETVKRDFID